MEDAGCKRTRRFSILDSLEYGGLSGRPPAANVRHGLRRVSCSNAQPLLNILEGQVEDDSGRDRHASELRAARSNDLPRQPRGTREGHTESTGQHPAQSQRQQPFVVELSGDTMSRSRDSRELVMRENVVDPLHGGVQDESRNSNTVADIHN